MSGTSRTATDLTQSFNMIEDRNLVMLPPLAQTLVGCFTVVQSDVATPPAELITVSAENNLLHIAPAATSGSGWAHEEISVDGAPGADIDKIIAFYGGGTLTALAHYPVQGGGDQVLGMQLTVETGWGPILMGPNMTDAFGQMRQTDRFIAPDGTVFVYGISQVYSPATFVIAAVNATGAWDLVFLEPVASPTASYRLLAGYDGDQLCVLTLDGSIATFRGGSLREGLFTWGPNPAVSRDLGLGTLTSERVYPIPSASGDQAFLLLTANQQLMHVSGYATGTPTGQALTGASGQPTGAQWVEIGLDSRNRFMVFAIGTGDNQLWLLRQTADAEANGPVAFNPWVQLGNTLGAIACPGTMTAGPELFFYDLSGNLAHMSQEVGSGVWFTSKILSPSASPESDPAADATTYTMELTAVDAFGAPVPKTVLKIFVDRLTVLVVNGLAYHAGPNTPAIVATDAFGRVAVSTEANALSSPALTVTAAEFGPGVIKGPYRCDARVHTRLAGQDPNFPVNGSSLVQAGLAPSTIPPSDADDVAHKLNLLGGAAVKKHEQRTGQSALAGGRAGAQCFAIDFTQPGRIFAKDISAEDFDAHVAGARFSVGDIFGDIVNFFKHLIQDLEHIAVKIEQDVVNFAITVAGEIKNFVLKTIAEIGDAMELILKRLASFFKDIIDAIETAIKWLRMLFAWGDIINTKKVLKYYITTGLNNIARDLSTDVPQYLTTLFGNIKGDITTAFNNLEAIFEASAGMNQMMPSSSSNPALQGGPPLTGTSMTRARSDNMVQCNYVHNKATQHFSTAGSPLAYAGDSGMDASALLDAFNNAFSTDELQASWEKMKAFSSQIHDATSFFDVIVLDLLEAFKDFLLIIIDGIEGVLIVLAQAAGSAITAFNAMLTHTIYIPIISNIYQDISGAPLSLLDLICLILAVPATILYKIIFTPANPTAPFSAADVSRITSTPLPWPSIPGAEVVRADGFSQVGDATGILNICYLLASAFYAVEDPLLDLLAAIEIDDPDSGEDGVSYGFGICAIVTSVMAAMFGAPWSTFTKPLESRTAADNWSIGLWCAGWAPVLFDIAFAIGAKTSKRITRFIPIGGPLIMAACGALMIGIGAKTVAEMKQDANYNAADETAALIDAFPYVFKPFIILGLTNEVGLAFNAALWIIDVACDVGEPVANMVATMNTSAEE
jgi:hypothetical protein